MSSDLLMKGSRVMVNNISSGKILTAVFVCLFVMGVKIQIAFPQSPVVPSKFILMNVMGQNSNPTKDFQQISSTFGSQLGKKTSVGVGYIISYLDTSPQHADNDLRRFLKLSEQYSLPVVIKLSGEQYWRYRPDLWNWWDKSKPGYNPKNKYNVEWYSWSPDSAVKIGWRNWGRQVRVLPMPNLMSPAYRAACDSEMARLVPILAHWWRSLPADKKYLFAGIIVGWESSIGVNNWYYPNGNALLDKPEDLDPTYKIQVYDLPSRGFKTIGYAAVSTLGLAHSGKLTEDQIAKVVQVHLERLSKICADYGIPRDHIFTHCGGWGVGDPNSAAALNSYSCPGWSFYDYAYNPADDHTVMAALQKSDAPYFSASEWLFIGRDTKEAWKSALQKTIAIPKFRFLDIYNWEGFKDNPAAIEAIREVTDNK